MPLTEAQQQVIAEKRRLALLKLQNAKASQKFPQPASTPLVQPAAKPSASHSSYTTKPAISILGRGNAIPASWKGNSGAQPSFYGAANAVRGSNNQTHVNFGNSLGVKRKLDSTPKEHSENFKNAKSGGNFGWKKGGRFKEGKLEVNFVLVSDTQFEIRSKFDANLVDLIKTLPNREYDSQTRYWKFPITNYESVLTKVQNCNEIQVTLSTPPKCVSRLAENYSIFMKKLETFKVDWTKLPNSDQLMPFQKDGVTWAVCRNGRAIIADDMGLGKTVQALMAAYYFKNEWPLLVVCPSSLRNTWADSIVQWLPDVDPGRINVIYTAADIHFDYKPDVIIVSYAMAPKLKNDLLKSNFKVVILDESHFVKTGKAIRTQAVQEIVRSTTRLLLLSGTPMLSKPIEMFTQLQLLERASFNNQQIYGTRYCNARQQPWGWDYNGSSNLEEFKVLLRYCGFLRRMKSEVLSQLPPKTRKIVSLDKNAVKNKEKMFASLSKKLISLESSKLMSGQNKQILFEYYNASAIAKLPAVINYITEIFESGVEKFLLFAHHVEMLDGVSDHLNKIKIDFIRIDGKTLACDRQPLVDKFQTDSKCKVALLSISAANTGLTLTAASLVIFAELYWNPGDLIQAEDRAYRIGQQCNVVVHYLIAEKTADDQIWPMVKNKLSVMKQAGLTIGDEFKDAEYEKQQTKAPARQRTLSFLTSTTSNGTSNSNGPTRINAGLSNLNGILSSNNSPNSKSTSISQGRNTTEVPSLKKNLCEESKPNLEDEAAEVTADLTLTQWDAGGNFDDFGDDDWGNDCDDLDLIQAADDVLDADVQTCRAAETNICQSWSKQSTSISVSCEYPASSETCIETGTNKNCERFPGSSNYERSFPDSDSELFVFSEKFLKEDSFVYLSDGDSNTDVIGAGSTQTFSPQIVRKSSGC